MHTPATQGWTPAGSGSQSGAPAEGHDRPATRAGRDTGTSRAWKAALVTAYLAWTGLVFLLCTVPPVSRDALTHHLAVPKLWIAHGGIYETPDIPFSYYPQLLELLYTLPLLWGQDNLAKYIHFAFALLTAGLIVAHLRSRVRPVLAWTGGLMFLTVPLILKLSVTVYVDLGLTFFGTAALLAAIRWLEHPHRWQWLALGGLGAGLALSTKYNALVAFTVLSLLLTLFAVRRREGIPPGRIAASVALFLAVALLVYSPWPLRNLTLTGNPIYPLHQSLFAQQERPPAPAAPQRPAAEKPLGPLTTRRLVYEEPLGYTLLIPFRIFFEGRDDDPRYFDGRLHPLLLILPLLLALRPLRKGLPGWELAFLGLYCALIVLYTFFTRDMRVRYVVAIVPPLVILTVYALHGLDLWLRQRDARPWARKAVPGALIAAFFMPNLSYAMHLWQKVEPVPLLLGHVDRETYIRTHLGDYAMVQLANRSVPAGGRVLGLYLGGRRYYFDVPVILDNGLPGRLAATADSGAALARRLTEQGFTHVLVRYDLFQHALSRLDPERQGVIVSFFRRHTVRLGAENGFGLHRIRTHGDPGRTAADEARADPDPGRGTPTS